jgi:hypothetical protein
MQTINEQAAQGIAASVESLPIGTVDRETLMSLCDKHARTKSGGAKFSATKLKDLVRSEVRSRLGLGKGELVPADVNGELCTLCDNYAKAWIDSQVSDGYQFIRGTAAKSVFIRDGEETHKLARRKTVTLQKSLTWREQIGDAKVELAGIADKLDKLDRGLGFNGKPHKMNDEQLTATVDRLQTRELRLHGVIARCETEIEQLAKLAKVNGIA